MPQALSFSTCLDDVEPPGHFSIFKDDNLEVVKMISSADLSVMSEIEVFLKFQIRMDGNGVRPTEDDAEKASAIMSSGISSITHNPESVLKYVG